MQITLLLPLNKKQEYGPLLQEYEKRLKSFCKFEKKFFKIFSDKNSVVALKKEAEFISKLIPKDSKLIVCDEKGKDFTSKSFSEELTKVEGAHYTFLIGGPFGVSPVLKDKCFIKLRLSHFTTHSNLAALFLIEQIYRCQTIIAGHPYHND